MQKLRQILESNSFFAFLGGFMTGVIFYMGIRAVHFWTWGTVYPMGY